MAELPKTQAPAPPNFYSNAAAMQGNAGATGSPKPKAAPASNATDQEFLTNVTKLLKVLDQLGDMNSRARIYTNTRRPLRMQCRKR